jgi:DNA-binding transcriptional ArsR family regulator
MLHTSIAALSDPNRFRIVELLRTGARPVNDIAGALRLNQPQVSKHLKVLKDAGWLDVEARAQQRLYQLQPAPLRELSEWLERYRSIWDARFTAMDDLIEGLANESSGQAKKISTQTKTKTKTQTRKERN